MIRKLKSRRRKNSKNKIFIFISLLIIFILVPIVASYILKSINSEELKINIKSYTINLDKFEINNDGKDSIETSNGINMALQYASKEKYNKVIMPKGEYSISENDPIIMLDNITLDLNGSTFKINDNGLQKYTVINFEGCKNSKLINGTILGDRKKHDYETIKGSHEWASGVSFNDSENCGVDNVTVKSFPGYGITSSLGKNQSNLDIGVTTDNLAIGDISKSGELNNKKGRIRTINPINISEVGEALELGYNKGYMGYPFMESKIYDSYFYDDNMKFISSIKNCEQYKKIIIPEKAFFVNFVFNQDIVPVNGDKDFSNTTVFLTNYKSPYKIKITKSLIEDNKSLGMGLCGGREFLIEGNIFKSNGGGAPGYAIDIEDGWEYVDNYVIRNNRFIDNSNDVVVCAGDNITFEGNKFSSTVHMWGRATNYKFINNRFENISQNINYEYSTDTLCTGNIYINSKINIESKNSKASIKIEKEELVNTSINYMSNGVEIKNSTIKSDLEEGIRLVGSFRDCHINTKKAYLIGELYESNIEDSNIIIQEELSFKDCNIKDSYLETYSNTESLTIDKSTLTNSRITTNTWGSPTIIDIQNSDIKINTGEKSFVEISAGKIKNLIFKNNDVISEIEKPVFDLFDTSYSIPNGNAIIEKNNFIEVGGKYIFDGVDISSGKFKLLIKGNKLKSNEIIVGKYMGSSNFENSIED